MSETNLFDMKKDQLVWSGTVETRDVDTVIDALKKRNLLVAR